MTLWYQPGLWGLPRFDAMTMTRSASVKYTSVVERRMPDLAPTCANSSAGNGATSDNRRQ